MKMKSTYPIAWHEEGLMNFKASMERRQRDIARLSAEVESMKKEIEFREFQLERAKKENKLEYNPETYCKKIKFV